MPFDPLDNWYAHTIDVPGHSVVLVTLTSVRFTVLLWDIQGDQWDNLDQLIVQEIRKVLQACGASQIVIDRYLPADTVLSLCGAADSSATASMTAVANRIRMELQAGADPKEMQHILNETYPGAKEEAPDGTPSSVMLEHLLDRYAPFVPAADLDPVPAMELECTLNLRVYKARRTLHVPADITFYTLHRYLQAAYRWDDYHLHEFILPAKRGRRYEQHILDQNTDSMFPNPRDVQDRETRLQDYLRECETFQYLYDFGDGWQVDIRYCKYLPDCTEDLPICTAYEGAPPPEDVGGIPGFAAFYKIVQNPKDPAYESMTDWVDHDWFVPRSAEMLTRSLHKLSMWESEDLDIEDPF